MLQSKQQLPTWSIFYLWICGCLEQVSELLDELIVVVVETLGALVPEAITVVDWSPAELTRANLQPDSQAGARNNKDQ